MSSETCLTSKNKKRKIQNQKKKPLTDPAFKIQPSGLLLCRNPGKLKRSRNIDISLSGTLITSRKGQEKGEEGKIREAGEEA
jgi:hypothetical protein